MNLFALALALVSAQPELVASASSPLNDYNLSIDDAHQNLVVARSEADFRNARIFTAARDASGAWTRPGAISFSDPRWSDSDPWLTPDGRTLYFISTRPAPGRDASRADYDIWRSVRGADGWSAPEHLGPEINSAGHELGPELHDGVLYFASARRSGRGGLDIYAARETGAGFATAALLDGPFNSAASDSDFTLNRDGTAALFWRAGADGRGVIHLSRRTTEGWSEPTPLPESINHGAFNFTPSFTSNGRSLLYASTRPREGQAEGLADIYWSPLP